MPHSPPWTPSGGVEGQELQQQGGSVSAEAEANALVAQSLASALGKCQFVADTVVPVWMLAAYTAKPGPAASSKTGSQKEPLSFFNQVA